MKHISIDAQDEAIQRFVLALAADPDGSLLELRGQVVACVLPQREEQADIEASGESWDETKNARRCALIDREIAGALRPEEAKELGHLQHEMLRHRRRVAPLPLADARRLHQELLQRAQSNRNGT